MVVTPSIFVHRIPATVHELQMEITQPEPLDESVCRAARQPVVTIYGSVVHVCHHQLLHRICLGITSTRFLTDPICWIFRTSLLLIDATLLTFYRGVAKQDGRKFGIRAHETLGCRIWSEPVKKNVAFGIVGCFVDSHHLSVVVIARCRFLATRPHGNSHVVRLGDNEVGPFARRTRNVPCAVCGIRIAIVFLRRRKMAVVQSLAEKLAFLVLALRGTGGNQPALLVNVRGGAVVLGHFVTKEFPVSGTQKQFGHPTSLFEECTLLDAI
mmetsp:Transcript_45314/g.51425  ORF Transcript_45314/g.51425 Transcript_45314/m.51425 type:complete len:269 (-) Transcript_45314:244-1050(-)